MAKNIEIELKFPLLNNGEVTTSLEKTAQFKYEALQHDVYFNPPHRSFLSDPKNVCEWFRVRVADNKAQVNYKDWLPHDQKIKTHCKEFETYVDSYEQLSNILSALDFVRLIDVKKVRKAWDYNDCEISIDSVEGLGEFIEIEYKGDLQDIGEARQYLFSVLQEIGAKTEEIDLKGYPFLLLEKKKLI